MNQQFRPLAISIVDEREPNVIILAQERFDRPTEAVKFLRAFFAHCYERGIRGRVGEVVGASHFKWREIL